MFSLKYGDATEIANELNQAFSSAARNIFRHWVWWRIWWIWWRSEVDVFLRNNNGNEQTSAQSGEGVLGLPELVAVPDARTNSVMVTTTAEQMDAVGKLIEQLGQGHSGLSLRTPGFSPSNTRMPQTSRLCSMNFSPPNSLNVKRQPAQPSLGGGFGGFGGGIRGWLWWWIWRQDISRRRR